MNFLKRAVLSVRARKGKSFLQVFIFTVICVLVLSGLAIQTAASKSADLARQSLGANVTLQFDMQNIEQQAEGGGRSRFLREPVILEDAQGLATYPNVVGFNMYSSTTAIANDFYPIEENVTEIEESIGSGKSGGMMMADVSLQGVQYSDSVQEFMDSVATIIEGRHLTEEDLGKHVVLVEQTLALENGLALGDRITVESQMDASLLELEIIGIYQTVATGDELGMSFTALHPYNKLFVPYTAVNELKGDSFIGTVDSAVYFLNDPVNIDSFITQAKTMSGIDFSKYKLDANDSLYQQMVGPINSVASFSQHVVFLVTAAGALILGLIVMMSIRERKYEMGVLLALGERKWKLIGQFIVEILIVAIVALGISTVSGNVVATQMSEQLLQQQLQHAEMSETPQSFRGPGMRLGAVQPVQTVEPVDELYIDITAQDLASLAFIGLFIAFIAALIPSLSVLRLQPKTILSRQD